MAKNYTEYYISKLIIIYIYLKGDFKMTTTYTALETLISDLRAMEKSGNINVNVCIMCGLSSAGALVPLKVDSEGRWISLLSDETEA